MAKRTFLSKLHTNGLFCIIGALLLFPGVPLYQLLILAPQGYGDALATTNATLHWINTHTLQFLGYRALLVLGFACMISLPFTLFRIIVAQEILGREEDEQDSEGGAEVNARETDGMPPFAWRGKGYAVLAAWSGLLGLLLSAGGTLTSTIYLLANAASASGRISPPANFSGLSGTFAIITYTAGSGLLALACLFFGAVIARSGRTLWPGVWVAFSYMALALAALLSGSAGEAAFVTNAGQDILTTPAILFFAIWVLWFGVMLVRLKPENDRR